MSETWQSVSIDVIKQQLIIQIILVDRLKVYINAQRFYGENAQTIAGDIACYIIWAYLKLQSMIKWHQYHGNLKKTQFPESIDEMESGIYSTREKGRHQTFLKHATYNKAHHVTILEQENRDNILTFSLTPDIWHH